MKHKELYYLLLVLMTYNFGIELGKEIFDRHDSGADGGGQRRAYDRDNDLPSNPRRDPHYSLPRSYHGQSGLYLAGVIVTTTWRANRSGRYRANLSCNVEASG